MPGALAAPPEDQVPPPKRAVGYIQVYTIFWGGGGKQTEQCLVWNVFKEKANSFAECGETGRGRSTV